jgi:diguanylate cyclase (GGDEF)-like protein
MNQTAKILIVDDEASIRNVLSEVLRDDGHQAYTADSGEQALELLDRQAFSLVIVDIKMPGISGMQLLEIIKRRFPETQVIIITSYASLDTSLEALRHGVYDYLLKPFDDLNQISAAARRAVEKVRLTQENHRLIEALKQERAQLKKANKFLKNLACRDGLTRLYNHRYFQEFLNFEMNRCHRNGAGFSIIFADLDQFKRFNDTNGHLEGDNLLRTLSVLLQKAVRKSDMIARYGGEEFVIVLPSVSKNNALRVAEKIRRYVESYPFIGRESQANGKVTLSIGIAGYPEDGNTPSALIHRADGAMFEAKNSGGNRVCVAGAQCATEKMN